MLFYPQLSTGSVVQYPLTKKLERQVVENTLIDGSRVVQLTTAPMITSWELTYSGLSDEERAMLTDFHELAEGRLRTFTFLDPTRNLLRWSEDLTNGVWARDLGIAVTGGIGGRSGTSNGTRLTNSGGGVQRLTQAIAGLGTLQYAMSGWFRTDVASGISLTIAAEDGGITKNFVAGGEWQMFTVAGRPGASGELVRFGFEMAAGTSVDLCEIAVAAQPAAAEYQKTFSTSGVRENVRFLNDRLIFTSHGPNDNSLRVGLVTTE